MNIVNIEEIITRFIYIKRQRLHGYFNALNYIFGEFERNEQIVLNEMYQGRRRALSTGEFYINHETKTALFKGVIMRTCKNFLFSVHSFIIKIAKFFLFSENKC